MTTKWFEFDQNNSGGSFVIDAKIGIGPCVWIEASNADHANDRAKRLGVYFDGVSLGLDCSCCGDRWYEASGEGEIAVKISDVFDFDWHSEVYSHPIEGPFIVHTKTAGS